MLLTYWKKTWIKLSVNHNAIHLIKNNLYKVDWKKLSLNKNIMEILYDYDYIKMKETMKVFCEELVSVVYHPVRMEKMALKYNFEMFDINEIY